MGTKDELVDIILEAYDVSGIAGVTKDEMNSISVRALAYFSFLDMKRVIKSIGPSFVFRYPGRFSKMQILIARWHKVIENIPGVTVQK